MNAKMNEQMNEKFDSLAKLIKTTKASREEKETSIAEQIKGMKRDLIQRMVAKEYSVRSDSLFYSFFYNNTFS